MKGRRKHRSVQQPVEQRMSEVAATLLHIIDIVIAITIILTPLAMGGRHPLGRLLLVTTVSVATCLWLVRQGLTKQSLWRRSPADWFLIAGFSLLVLQLAPLSTDLVRKLSPGIADHLMLWTSNTDSAAFMGEWNRISLVPANTMGGLVMFTTYACLFFVIVQRIEKIADIHRIYRWIAVAGGLMAVIGLAQYLMGNGKFLWIYEHPFRDTTGSVKGAFANSNHFAHFLALSVGGLMWWLHHQQGTVQRQPSFDQRRSAEPASSKLHEILTIALPIGLGMLMFAGLLSFSRGGALALTIASVGCVSVMYRAQLVGRGAIIATAGGLLLIAVAVLTHGWSGVQREVETITSASTVHDISQGRSKLWTALGNAIPNYWMFGSGVGSHRDVYHTYFDGYTDVEFSHAESGYLQILLETGVAGFVLMMSGACLCCLWVLGSIRHGERETLATAAPLVGAFGASLGHSITDFVWYIPACMMLTVVLAACACRLYQLSYPKAAAANYVPRSAWIGATVIMLFLCGGMISNRISPALASNHWDNYLKLSLASNEFSLMARVSGQAQTDGVFDPLDPENVSLLIAHLDATLKRSPNDARAHLRMASLCLRQFELAQQHSDNAMGLTQIRDAAIASGFPTKTAQRKWLDVAVGENMQWLDRALFHTRRALQGSPYQGDGYVYLAELAFMLTPESKAKHDYIEQALSVRPYSGRVLFAAGGEAALTGDTERAIEFWKEAFHRDPRQRNNIIAVLAKPQSATLFLEEFQPEVDGLQKLFRFYQSIGAMQDAQLIAGQLLPLLDEQARQEDGLTAARTWGRARIVQRALGDPVKAVDYAKSAVRAAPDDYRSHRELALQLLEARFLSEALEELKWCLRRRPDDDSLKKALATTQQRLDQPRISQLPTADSPPLEGNPYNSNQPINGAPPMHVPQSSETQFR